MLIHIGLQERPRLIQLCTAPRLGPTPARARALGSFLVHGNTDFAELGLLVSPVPILLLHCVTSTQVLSRAGSGLRKAETAQAPPLEPKALLPSNCEARAPWSPEHVRQSPSLCLQVTRQGHGVHFCSSLGLSHQAGGQQSISLQPFPSSGTCHAYSRSSTHGPGTAACLGESPRVASSCTLACKAPPRTVQTLSLIHI